MEIGPIPGIRLATFGKNSPAVIGLQRVSDMENYAHISDESYTPSQEASDGGMEDDFYETGAAEDEPEQQPATKAGNDDDSEHRLSFFA
jgi:hypothetical protein